eukprot:TRINITY_DN26766_c0_g1_i1.p1 TRINITY_DN26766_c0_g1~~TRINITY_DN26766_c0_g1_i1.p1  ORF type:complete len:720 (-),score=111.98 TRINITY_DN26766_c0_g1_i1:84-2243(-)
MPACATAIEGLAVGCGCCDITGPVAEVGLMGYGNLRQKAAGLHFRLRSRAFVFGREPGRPSFAFVSADLWACTEAVKTAVVDGLQDIFGSEVYTKESVLISGTHTHSGPGGFSHHALYNFSVLGFQRENFDCICKGIVRSIVRAHASLEPASCHMNFGFLRDLSGNRSKTAYSRNPEQERELCAGDVDEEVTVMRFDGVGSLRPMGLISWFGMHPTSMDRDNTLVSGDNKGVASYLFERKFMKADYRAPNHFVAAFAQCASLGDVSPNCGDNGAGTNFTKALWSGMRQFEKTRELWADSAQTHKDTISITSLQSAHRYVDFSDVEISLDSQGSYLESVAESQEAWAFSAGIDSKSQLQVATAASQGLASTAQRLKTAPAAVGAAGGAGSTSDGPSGLPGLAEGQLKSPSVLYDFARELLARTSPELRRAHSPKPVLLATGLMDPPWTPKILPLQLLVAKCAAPRCWAFVIAGVPFELSTMASRRLRSALRGALGAAEDCPIILAGLANAYAGYCVTYEEYQQQDYEGGMTMFGPHQLAALTQEFCALASSLTSPDVHQGNAVISPPDLRRQQWNMQTGVIADKPLAGLQFGSLTSDTLGAYFAGTVVSASFCSGHPKNSVGAGLQHNSFLEVQRLLADGTWARHADDGDLETVFRWRRRGIAASEVSLEWHIPADVPPGTYRLVHFGHARSLKGAVLPYQGVSRVFEVRPRPEVIAAKL